MKFLQVFYISFAGLLFSKASEACSERQDCIDRQTSFSKALLQVSQVSQNRVSKRDSFGMCVVRDDTCLDLFLDRNWDDGVTANQAPELKWSDAQLVVARYDEDLRWLDALPQIPAVVYNRGEAHSVLLPSPRENLRIIQQPNRGREDQVFLEHIVNNYDKLAQATVFLQGWPFGHCPGFLHAVRRALTFVLDPQVAGPTTAGYVEGLAPVTSTFWQYNTQNGRVGLAVEMARRHLPDELSHTAESVVRETYSRVCTKLLDGKPCPSLQWVAEGAQWAVSRERILRTPRHVYHDSNSMRSELGCPIARVVARLFSLNLFQNPNLFQNKTSPKASVRKEEAEASKESIEGPEGPVDSVDDISEILGKPKIPVAAARLATTTDDLQEVLNEELVAVSSCFEELFGYSRHELKGKSILRLLSISGMVDPQLEIYLNMVEQGMRMFRGVQVSLRRKTGELVESQVYIKKAALPGAAGEVEEVLLFYFSDLGVVDEVEATDMENIEGCSML